MDIAENGISAGASLIRILVNEDRQNNLLTVEIEDNGRGMSAEMLAQVTDPFITSRTTRRVGLGLSLLQAAAHRCEGEFKLESEIGKGTLTSASFQYDHIDRAPVGDMAGTLTVLMMGNPNIDFNYTHQVDKKDFTLDTAELRKDMEGFSLTDPTVMVHLTRTIRNAVSELRINTNKGDTDDKS